MRLFTSTPGRRLLLLAPSRFAGETGFGSVEHSESRYGRLLGNMQRLRGRIYVADGAIEPTDLTSDGRHRQAMDADSWHLLSVDGKDRVYGCARYRHYGPWVDFPQLGVGQSEIAHSECWGAKLRQAVEQEIATARREQRRFVEVGGWALSEEMRFSSEALRIAIGLYGFAQLMGGCVGLTTATVRHCSSAILRKIGGTSLFSEGTEIPKYFDSRYRCEMEILRFVSASPNPRYSDWIERVKADLASVEQVTADVGAHAPVGGLSPAAHSIFAGVPQYT